MCRAAAWRTPLSPKYLSSAHRVQVPPAGLPSSTDSGEVGWKVAAPNGATAVVLDRAASSSKVASAPVQSVAPEPKADACSGAMLPSSYPTQAAAVPPPGDER